MKNVVFLLRRFAVATANNTLRARVAQDYCWMWSNKSTESVTLNVKLQRE